MKEGWHRNWEDGFSHLFKEVANIYEPNAQIVKLNLYSLFPIISSLSLFAKNVELAYGTDSLNLPRDTCLFLCLWHRKPYFLEYLLLENYVFHSQLYAWVYRGLIFTFEYWEYMPCISYPICIKIYWVKKMDWTKPKKSLWPTDLASQFIIRELFIFP